MSSLTDSSSTKSMRVVRGMTLTVAPLSLVNTMLLTSTSNWDSSSDALSVSATLTVPLPVSLLLEQLAPISASATMGRNRFMGCAFDRAGGTPLCRCYREFEGPDVRRGSWKWLAGDHSVGVDEMVAP